MLNITQEGNSVKFTGTNNKLYPDNGVLTVPFNSLILVIDESDVVTFRSVANNDVYCSGKISDIRIDGETVTKQTIISAFDEIANQETGGGGGNEAFPSGWSTTGTMLDLITDINNDDSVHAGDVYLDTVFFSDLPSDLVQAEIKVEIMSEEEGLGKVILFTVTSNNTSPYHWEYTSAYCAAGTWRSWATVTDLATLFDGAVYDSQTKRINFKHGNTILTYIDATAFIKDGMVDSVVISNGNLVITFNTDAGKEPITIPLTDIFNPNNYYTKSATDALLNAKANSADLATVATSGSYNDLSNKPTNVSSFNNDAGYITMDDLAEDNSIHVVINDPSMHHGEEYLGDFCSNNAIVSVSVDDSLPPGMMTFGDFEIMGADGGYIRFNISAEKEDSPEEELIIDAQVMYENFETGDMYDQIYSEVGLSTIQMDLSMLGDFCMEGATLIPSMMQPEFTQIVFDVSVYQSFDEWKENVNTTLESTTALANQLEAALDEKEEVVARAINELNDDIEGKQATLVSGTNIKTINNVSLLGSGNIDIQGGGGGITGITMNGSSVTVTSGVADLGTVVTDKSDKQDVIDSSHKLSADLVDDTSTTNKFVTASDKSTWSGKQDALVSGTNIKTINNESILGSGNITIQGGGGTQVQSDWNQTDNTQVDYIKNKPTDEDVLELLEKDESRTVTIDIPSWHGGVDLGDICSNDTTISVTCDFTSLSDGESVQGNFSIFEDGNDIYTELEMEMVDVSTGEHVITAIVHYINGGGDEYTHTYTETSGDTLVIDLSLLGTDFCFEAASAFGDFGFGDFGFGDFGFTQLTVETDRKVSFYDWQERVESEISATNTTVSTLGSTVAEVTTDVTKLKQEKVNYTDFDIFDRQTFEVSNPSSWSADIQIGDLETNGSVVSITGSRPSTAGEERGEFQINGNSHIVYFSATVSQNGTGTQIYSIYRVTNIVTGEQTTKTKRVSGNSQSIIIELPLSDLGDASITNAVMRKISPISANITNISLDAKIKEGSFNYWKTGVDNAVSQRVLTEEDPITGVHAGVKVVSAHWDYTTQSVGTTEETDVATDLTFVNNVPAENADPTVQANFLDGTLMEFEITQYVQDTSSGFTFDPSQVTGGEMYGYNPSTGEWIDETSSGGIYHPTDFAVGEKFRMNSTLLSALVTAMQTDCPYAEMTVEFKVYAWDTNKSVSAVHSGTAYQLAYNSDLTTLAGRVTNLETAVGNISSSLDTINGEVI